MKLNPVYPKQNLSAHRQLFFSNSGFTKTQPWLLSKNHLLKLFLNNFFLPNHYFPSLGPCSLKTNLSISEPNLVFQLQFIFPLVAFWVRNWFFDTNWNFLIHISLQTVAVKLWYFQLWLFKISKVYDIELQR